MRPSPFIGAQIGEKGKCCKTYQYEMKEDLFANGLVSVNIANVFHLRFARYVPVWR